MAFALVNETPAKSSVLLLGGRPSLFSRDRPPPAEMAGRPIDTARSVFDTNPTASRMLRTLFLSSLIHFNQARPPDWKKAAGPGAWWAAGAYAPGAGD